MARILITSGPTRQYIDPVRYLTNASSGQMGRCLAHAALDRGHDVVVVSGPVHVQYPAGCRVIDVVTTDDMLSACLEEFPECDGLIGAAAPCDYRPLEVHRDKLKKTGQVLELQLIETPDVVAMLGARKRDDQWTVGFALETEDAHFRAITKLQKKACDLVVINGVAAINAAENSVDIIDATGAVVFSGCGPKPDIANSILDQIHQRLLQPQV